MSFAIMGGLFRGAILTLIVLPAMYSTLFRTGSRRLKRTPTFLPWRES